MKMYVYEHGEKTYVRADGGGWHTDLLYYQRPYDVHRVFCDGEESFYDLMQLCYSHEILYLHRA